MNTTEFRTQLLEQEAHLLRYARSLTTNTEDANDLLQETCVRSYSNLLIRRERTSELGYSQ